VRWFWGDHGPGALASGIGSPFQCRLRG